MGSTLRNLTAAGVATRCGMRRFASSWFSVVVPSQTVGQPSPQSIGSMSRMFCGLFVSKNQSSAGVERMSDHKSTRHDVGHFVVKDVGHARTEDAPSRAFGLRAFVPAERPTPVGSARSLAVCAYVPQIAPLTVAPPEAP